MPNEVVSDQISKALSLLERSGYKVLRPARTPAQFTKVLTPGDVIRVAIVDTETTGSDVTKDRMIEFGALVVEVCPKTGTVGRILDSMSELDDPGIPCSPVAEKIHHITADMLCGKRIDDARVASLMSNVSVVIAHHAAFDRPILERRFPLFKDKLWGCSATQVPWKAEGYGAAKLEYLAFSCGITFAPHRAINDCLALLEVLSTVTPAGNNPMKLVIDRARSDEVMVSAVGAPFETKDALKMRGYFWIPAKKTWARTIPELDLDAEKRWLKDTVYAAQVFSAEFARVKKTRNF